MKAAALKMSPRTASFIVANEVACRSFVQIVFGVPNILLWSSSRRSDSRLSAIAQSVAASPRSVLSERSVRSVPAAFWDGLSLPRTGPRSDRQAAALLAENPTIGHRGGLGDEDDLAVGMTLFKLGEGVSDLFQRVGRRDWDFDLARGN